MRGRFGVVLAVLAFVPHGGWAAKGGPDAGGYSWADQAEPGIDNSVPTATGPPLAVSVGSDSVSAPVNLGFTFPFYGVNYTQVVVSDNGWISFNTALTNSAPTPTALPNVANPSALLAWYWRDLNAPDFVSYYRFSGGGFFHIRSSVPASSELIQAFVILYASGCVKFVYQVVDLPNTASIGIEDAAGNIGANPWYLGLGLDGFAVNNDTVLRFCPAPKLSCTGSTTVNCGQTLASASPATLAVNTNYYACSNNPYLGRERVFSFTNPVLSDVSFELLNLAPATIDLDLFVLRAGACNEFLCLAGGGDRVDFSFLPPGNYQVVVDGRAVTDVGNFNLRVTCTPKGATLTCGSLGVPGTTSGVSNWTTYNCTNQSLDGPEFVYEIPFTAPGNLKVKLNPTTPGAELDLLSFGPNTFNPPSGCGVWGDGNLTLFNPPSGTYFIAVDGRGGVNAGSYTIDLDCRVLLDCSAPAADLQCFTPTSGTTVGAVNNVEQYSCSPDLFTGPETVYRFRNNTQRTVSFLWNGPAGLSMFLVGGTTGSCNEGSCVDFGDGRLVARDLPVGDYFLVVDGAGGASGAFTVTPICSNLIDPPTGSWVLDPGMTISEHKLSTLNADITRGDVVFAMDLTASMGVALANLKTTSQQIITELSTVVDDVEFGLVSFEDYPASFTSCAYSGPYGSGSDSPYRRNLSITGDQAALFTAIDSLNLGDGQDLPESYTRVWYEMYADATNLGWRTGSKRIAVMIGDDEPHTCDGFACITSRTSTGIDPGRDNLAGTADDLEIRTVMNELRTRGTVPIYLFTGNPGKPNLLQPWQCWTQGGGGDAYLAPGGTAVPGLVDTIRELIETKSLLCETLEVRASAGFSAWVRNATGPFLNVGLPAQVAFDFDIGPPLGTLPGIYNFTVDIVCDGLIKVSQLVTIEVPGVCTPNPQVSVSGNQCAGNNRTFDASASVIPGCPGPIEWQWKDALSTVIQPWSTTGSVLSAVPPTTTSYTVEIRCVDQAACPFIGMRTINVLVDAAPPADAGANRVICLTQSTRLGAPGSPGYQYSWSPSTELDNSLIAQPTFSTNVTSPLGPRVYTLTVTDPSNGCFSTSIVTVDVVNGAPVGVIGNNLRAVRSGTDVELEWRPSPLAPRSYNIHRELLKTQITPPVSLPVGQAGGDEIYRDPAVIPLPTLYFYKVYGRDCGGTSIINY